MLSNTPIPAEKEMVETIHTFQETESLEDKQNDTISVQPAYVNESESVRQLPPEISTETKERDTDQSNDINAAILKFPDKTTCELTSDEYRGLKSTRTKEAETKADVIRSNNEKDNQHPSDIDQSHAGIEKEQLSDQLNELNGTSNSPALTTSGEDLPMENDQSLSNSIDMTVTGTNLQEDKIKKTTEHLQVSRSVSPYSNLSGFIHRLDQAINLAAEPSVSNNKMLVIFRAVIPKDVWEWDESAKVCMRFGNPELGNWETDYGPGQVERY